jgi:Asp/Glu/hydantoin racemase
VAPPRIFLVHALRDAIDPARAAMARGWPEARVANLLDDSLSADHAGRGGVLDDPMRARFRALTQYAVATGADGILFTCSAFGDAIEEARATMAIPVLKPDEAALEAALDAGPRIALLATFPATIPSITRELHKAAGQRGVTPVVTTGVVAGALRALQDGDAARHDALIAEAAAQYEDADALVLAQFSMARAAHKIGGRRVLATPDSAVAKLRRLVEGSSAEGQGVVPRL